MSSGSEHPRSEASPTDDLLAVRTVVAVIVGATLGALALGAGLGQAVTAAVDPDRSGESLATLGVALWGGAIGALAGAAAALAVALRRAPGRSRRTTIVTLVVAGPLLCAAVAVAIGQTALGDEWDARHLFVVWIAVVLPVAALLGRGLASRRDAGDGAD